MINLKKYIKNILIKYSKKIDVDNDFYDEIFYLSDMEGDDNCTILLFR